MNFRVKSKFDAQLPAIPCTSDMRRAIETIGKQEQTSMAEVLRFAVALFLEENAKYSSKNGNGDSTS